MSFQLRGKVIFFATNNINKFNEARKLLAEYKIAVGMLRVKAREIQSDDLEEIAKASAQEAFEKCGLPIIVEDAGLFVECLKRVSRPIRFLRIQNNRQRGLAKAHGECGK
jgi:XTP/dITP diphosphohydrolase